MESIVEERSGGWPTERSETADRVQLTNELTASTVATGLTVERVTDCNTPYGSNLDNSLYLQSLSVVLFYTQLLSFLARFYLSYPSQLTALLEAYYLSWVLLNKP